MSLVRKILEATIPSGGSSATFTDSDIPNSLIRVYSTNGNIYPQNISLAGTTLTVTYEQVTSALGVAVELVKQGLEIDDNLTSDNTDHALSAKQGKVLKGLIDAIPAGITELSELDDVDITDLEDGQVLAWSDSDQKFINVDQSGGGSSNIYSTTETVVGEWFGQPLYRKVINFGALPNNTSKSVSHGITNLQYPVHLYGFAYGAGILTLPFVTIDHGSYQIALEISTTDVKVYTDYDRSSLNAYIIIEYTKSTD